MPTLLLDTKLYLPRSPHGLVPRPRLRERLDRGATSALMLVSAPAGFGKSTLLAEWLAAGPAAPADERFDATIVRMVLVPATMALLGRANWWLPGWLDRLLPHLSLEQDAAGPESRPVRVLVPEVSGAAR